MTDIWMASASTLGALRISCVTCRNSTHLGLSPGRLTLLAWGGAWTFDFENPQEILACVKSLVLQLSGACDVHDDVLGPVLEPSKASLCRS